MASRDLSHPLSAPASKGVGALLALALLMVGLVALLPLLEATQTTSTGFSVSQLEARRDELEVAVQQLEVEVASLASLERVEQEARAAGFVEPAETLVLQVGEESPLGGPTPPELRPSLRLAEEEPEGGPAWWQRFLALFDLR